jgi:hypothetical protein
MARLELPELHETDIPWQTKRAMLNHIPVGALAWSGEPMGTDLKRYLAKAKPTNWVAAGKVLAQDGSTDWLNAMGVPLASKELSMGFWNEFGCLLHFLKDRHPETNTAVLEGIGALAQCFPEHANNLQSVARRVHAAA